MSLLSRRTEVGPSGLNSDIRQPQETPGGERNNLVDDGVFGRMLGMASICGCALRRSQPSRRDGWPAGADWRTPGGGDAAVSWQGCSAVRGTRAEEHYRGDPTWGEHRDVTELVTSVDPLRDEILISLLRQSEARANPLFNNGASCQRQGGRWQSHPPRLA